MFYAHCSCGIRSVILEPPGGSVTACVHDNIVITCTVSPPQIIWWTLTDLNNASVFEQELYAPVNSGKLPADIRPLGDFMVRLESNSPLVSTATLNDTAPENNGTWLACSKNDNFDYSLPGEFAAITILVEGKQYKHVVRINVGQPYISLYDSRLNLLLPCSFRFPLLSTES